MINEDRIIISVFAIRDLSFTYYLDFDEVFSMQVTSVNILVIYEPSLTFKLFMSSLIIFD